MAARHGRRRAQGERGEGATLQTISNRLTGRFAAAATRTICLGVAVRTGHNSRRDGQGLAKIRALIGLVFLCRLRNLWVTSGVRLEKRACHQAVMLCRLIFIVQGQKRRLGQAHFFEKQLEINGLFRTPLAAKRNSVPSRPQPGNPAVSGGFAKRIASLCTPEWLARAATTCDKLMAGGEIRPHAQ